MPTSPGFCRRDDCDRQQHDQRDPRRPADVRDGIPEERVVGQPKGRVVVAGARRRTVEPGEPPRRDQLVQERDVIRCLCERQDTRAAADEK